MFGKHRIAQLDLGSLCRAIAYAEWIAVLERHQVVTLCDLAAGCIRVLAELSCYESSKLDFSTWRTIYLEECDAPEVFVPIWNSPILNCSELVSGVVSTVVHSASKSRQPPIGSCPPARVTLILRVLQALQEQGHALSAKIVAAVKQVRGAFSLQTSDFSPSPTDLVRRIYSASRKSAELYGGCPYPGCILPGLADEIIEVTHQDTHPLTLNGFFALFEPGSRNSQTSRGKRISARVLFQLDDPDEAYRVGPIRLERQLFKSLTCTISLASNLALPFVKDQLWLEVTKAMQGELNTPSGVVAFLESEGILEEAATWTFEKAQREDFIPNELLSQMLFGQPRMSLNDLKKWLFPIS